ncbi:MAG: hypothetical protein AB8F65_08700 [Woeseiaceae bacterium]
MSKLQEALRRISQSKSAEKGQQGGSRQGARRRVSSERSKSSFVEVRDGNTLEEEGALEHHVSLSDEVLSSSGLKPLKGYEDQLARQFGRIKRPIMVNAFDLARMTTENSNVVMIASALPSTGKSFCALNLARSIAQERDFGALLVDADVLKPRVSLALKLEDRLGLIDYLLDDQLTLDDVLVQTDYEGVIVLPAGSQHRDATELLASRRMRDLVKRLSERFQSRAVVFDTPPLLLTNEAVVLSKYMGQIALVIEAGQTATEAVNAAVNLLDRDKPINCILNKVREFAGDIYGSYGYGYNYGPPLSGEEEVSEQ